MKVPHMMCGTFFVYEKVGRNKHCGVCGFTVHCMTICTALFEPKHCGVCFQWSAAG